MGGGFSAVLCVCEVGGCLNNEKFFRGSSGMSQGSRRNEGKLSQSSKTNRTQIQRFFVFVGCVILLCLVGYCLNDEKHLTD